MKSKSGDKTPDSHLLFDNMNNEKKTVDEKENVDVLNVVNNVFDRIEQICVLLFNDFLNEEEAARYLRLVDPKNKGSATLRNYALRSKKLSFAKVGRTGLLFNKKDLNKLFDLMKAESFKNS